MNSTSHTTRNLEWNKFCSSGQHHNAISGLQTAWSKEKEAKITGSFIYLSLVQKSIRYIHPNAVTIITNSPTSYCLLTIRPKDWYGNTSKVVAAPPITFKVKPIIWEH